MPINQDHLDQIRALQAKIVRKQIHVPAVFRDETIWGHVKRVAVQALSKKKEK